MATKKKEDFSLLEINIPAPELQLFSLRIVGDSPLVVHAWATKTKQQLLDQRTKKAKATGREIKKPAVEFANSLHWLTPKPDFDSMTDAEAQSILTEIIPKSKFGFPSVAFKACALNGGFQQGALVKNAGGADLAKTTARGAFHIIGEFVEIEGTPTIREDMVKVGSVSKQPDIRYRGEFKVWNTTLNIRYNAKVLTVEQIANLLNIGGFANGIGEWRPEKNGTFGTFHVALKGE